MVSFNTNVVLIKNPGGFKFYKYSALFSVLIMIPAHILMMTRPKILQGFEQINATSVTAMVTVIIGVG